MGCGVTSVRSESRGYTRSAAERVHAKGYGFMRALHWMGNAPLSNGTTSEEPRIQHGAANRASHPGFS
eukprot:3609635-Prymnesium_polylepis.1